ncbi:MAG TPA: NlpC/P60 family protein [Leptospiraceae bacterium]|nr:NlpC/P60 family protein [Leptospiraceae bacterium]
MKFFNLIFICTLLLFNAENTEARKLTKEEKKKLREIIQSIGKQKISYGKKWKPPGSDTELSMDCSNTAKYLYQVAFGVTLPRSAYDQYDLVSKTGGLHTVPTLADKSVDIEKLKKKLKSGDLLFWIDTHSEIPSDRSPSIGHVMIFLGKTKSGKMKMGGAGTFGKGEYNLNGGVDIYPFNPNDFQGCVKDSSKKCIRNSKFIGFGKPPF